MSFPSALDTFTNPTSANVLANSTPPHSQQHANLNDAVAAQAKVGADGSSVIASFDYRLRAMETSPGAFPRCSAGRLPSRPRAATTRRSTPPSALPRDRRRDGFPDGTGRQGRGVWQLRTGLLVSYWSGPSTLTSESVSSGTPRTTRSSSGQTAPTTSRNGRTARARSWPTRPPPAGASFGPGPPPFTTRRPEPPRLGRTRDHVFRLDTSRQRRK
jgi:hypothetical protein